MNGIQIDQRYKTKCDKKKHWTPRLCGMAFYEPHRSIWQSRHIVHCFSFISHSSCFIYHLPYEYEYPTDRILASKINNQTIWNKRNGVLAWQFIMWKIINDERIHKIPANIYTLKYEKRKLNQFNCMRMNMNACIRYNMEWTAIVTVGCQVNKCYHGNFLILWWIMCIPPSANTKGSKMQQNNKK